MVQLEVDYERMDNLLNTIDNISLLLQVLVFMIAIIFMYCLVRNFMSRRK